MGTKMRLKQLAQDGATDDQVMTWDDDVEMWVPADAAGGGGSVEAWREVGALGEPAFQNSWANFGGAFNTAAFRKDSMGRVHLKGLVKNGAPASATMFTLPLGYRPVGQALFAVVANNTFGRLDIPISGGLSLQVGASAFVSLDGVAFFAV